MLNYKIRNRDPTQGRFCGSQGSCLAGVHPGLTFSLQLIILRPISQAGRLRLTSLPTCEVSY